MYRLRRRRRHKAAIARLALARSRVAMGPRFGVGRQPGLHRRFVRGWPSRYGFGHFQLRRELAVMHHRRLEPREQPLNVLRMFHALNHYDGMASKTVAPASLDEGAANASPVSAKRRNIVALPTDSKTR